VPSGLAVSKSVERQQRRPQRIADRHALIDIVELDAHALEVSIEVAPGQCVLGRVVAKEGAARDACRVRDVVDADLVETSRREEVDRDIAEVVGGRGLAPTNAML
jgi:hypothetical protein